LLAKSRKDLPTVSNSSIKTYFEKPIELDLNKQYEMALVGLETYRSYPKRHL
jgi:hypothetical protein